MLDFFNTKLERTIDALGKLIDLFKEQKWELLEKYKVMNDKEIIKDLSKIVYTTIGPNSTYYDYALDIILNYNYSICKTKEDLKVVLDKTFNGGNR